MATRLSRTAGSFTMTPEQYTQRYNDKKKTQAERDKELAARKRAALAEYREQKKTLVRTTMGELRPGDVVLNDTQGYSDFGYVNQITEEGTVKAILKGEGYRRIIVVYKHDRDWGAFYPITPTTKVLRRKRKGEK